MQPLLITATTPHGVVLSRPFGIAFDGLLASVLWHRRKHAARAAGQHLTYNPTDTPEDLDLPLARCGSPEHDPDWHWMATFCDLHPRTADPDIRWRTARTDRHRLQHLAPRIGTHVVSDSSGRYQRRIIPVAAHPTATLTWRAVGNADDIAELLAELTSIGKHRNVGEGVVTRWDIRTLADTDDWAAGHEHAPGVLGRICPTRCYKATSEAGPLGTAPVRPPYQHSATRTSAYFPVR